jgi:hypothetical protein
MPIASPIMFYLVEYYGHYYNIFPCNLHPSLWLFFKIPSGYKGINKGFSERTTSMGWKDFGAGRRRG